MQRRKIIVGLTMLLVGGTVLSSSAQSVSLSDIQKKELTLFGMKAMGVNVDISQVINVPSTPEVHQMVATGLNLNGHLCAELVAIRPLNVKSTYEATCIASRGGSAQKSYTIYALKGVALGVALIVREQAQACDYPERVTIPNGSVATKDEMVATQRGVKKYMAYMEAYLACIAEEDWQLRAGFEDPDPLVSKAALGLRDTTRPLHGFTAPTATAG